MCQWRGAQKPVPLFLYNGKTRLDSVPKAYKDAISQCIKDYEDITALLIELSSINLELFRRREIDL